MSKEFIESLRMIVGIICIPFVFMAIIAIPVAIILLPTGLLFCIVPAASLIMYYPKIAIPLMIVLLLIKNYSKYLLDREYDKEYNKYNEIQNKDR